MNTSIFVIDYWVSYLKLLSLSNCQDFLSDDFKSQGSHVPYNVAEFSTQVMNWIAFGVWL